MTNIPRDKAFVELVRVVFVGIASLVGILVFSQVSKRWKDMNV